MEIFEFVKRLHDQSLNLSKRIIFNKKHPRHFYLIALYASLIELTGVLITLIERKYKTGVPSVFRQVVDAYVEFKNLYEKPEYVYSMEASYHKELVKILKVARTKSNTFLKSISEVENLDQEIQKYEQELTELKEKGYKPLKVIERFELAGMNDEYLSVYNFLSNDAHNNIQALVSRHVEAHENDFVVVCYKDEPLETFLPYLDSTAVSLLDASKRIHQFFNTESISDIEKLGKQLGEIRSRYKLLGGWP